MDFTYCFRSSIKTLISYLNKLHVYCFCTRNSFFNLFRESARMEKIMLLAWCSSHDRAKKVTHPGNCKIFLLSLLRFSAEHILGKYIQCLSGSRQKGNEMCQSCRTVNKQCYIRSDWSDPSPGLGIFQMAVLFLCMGEISAIAIQTFYSVLCCKHSFSKCKIYKYTSQAYLADMFDLYKMCC